MMHLNNGLVLSSAAFLLVFFPCLHSDWPFVCIVWLSVLTRNGKPAAEFSFEPSTQSISLAQGQLVEVCPSPYRTISESWTNCMFSFMSCLGPFPPFGRCFFLSLQNVSGWLVLGPLREGLWKRKTKELQFFMQKIPFHRNFPPIRKTDKDG